MKAIILSITVLLLAASLGGCLVDYSLKQPGTSIPEQLDDGWVVSSPMAEYMDGMLINEAYSMFYDEGQFYNALALLILRNGRIVFETYTRSPEDRERLHHVASVTKSVASLVFGIIRGKGYFPDLDAPLASYMPEKFIDAPEKCAITIRHLLTMKSGIDFDNDVFSLEMYVDRPLDPFSYILHKPMYTKPGEKFYYRDCDPHLLSLLVGQVTGKTLESWATEYLFQQIGIVRYHWGKDQAGTTMGAHGLYMKPRDLARFGQLLLQRGCWNGTEVVSEDWIDESTMGRTESSLTEYDYGYYWWIVPELTAVTAWGHGGNFIFVAPEKDLIIVMVSMPDVDDGSIGTTLSEFMPLATVIFDACL